MLTNLFDALLDFFYSPVCPNCGAVCITKNRLCDVCRKEAAFVRVYTKQELTQLDAIIVLTHYRSGLQNVLHKLKFFGEKKLLPVLQNEFLLLWQNNGNVVLQDLLFKHSLHKENIAVVPVPTDEERYLARGFDVPKAVFNDWCLQNGFAWHSCLHRVEKTAAQYTLSVEKRKTNMQNVMKLEYLPSEKVIIVVDDVLTTGATMVECARAIRAEKGVDKFIIGLALASDMTK